jgi:hypothetical protein
MLDNLPQHIYIFAAILGFLSIAFLVFFCVPSFVVSLRLSRVIRRLGALKGKPNDKLDELFSKSGVLEHLWREYSHTLHRQTEVDAATGQQRITRYRSTIPAEALFRSEVIVDTPLRTDFFKHLPGIFTGIGIIGTFYGLLIGLQAFQVSENAGVVRDSLNRLLHGVWEAFLVSAVAIALAMIATLIEKLLITRLNGKVGKLVQLLDGLFETGAGEEYLARLVKASESNASQTAILKDALVGELKQILTDLTEKQIAAANAGTTALGERIGNSLEEGLKAPLVEIADAFKGVRSDQGAAVQAMLTDVLSAFSQQLKELFGDQITGINSLQQQTIEALQTAVVKLEQMATSVETAGQRGASAMADQLAEAMAAAEARQRIMNEKMAEFVDQIRLAISNSQNETQGTLQGTLVELSERMGAVIESLTAQVQSAANASRQHQDELASHTMRVVGEFGGQVEAVVEGVNRAVAEMKSAVEAMQDTTTDALAKLNSGADTLYVAANDFAKAGEGVTTSLEKSAALANQLSQAAGSVAGASTSLGGIVADYKSARDAIAGLVESLRIMIEHARKEASINGDVISRIEGATSKLVDAQREAESYLARVSEVIGEAHGSFSEGMKKALGDANREFHRQLSDSVKLLREGIQELEATFGTITTH